MAGVYRGLTIELGADSSALDSALKKSERQARSLENEMKKVSRSLTFKSGSTEAYERQMKLLGDSVKNAEEKLKMLKTAMADPANAGKATEEQMSRLKHEIAETEAKIGEYNRQMAELKARHEGADGAIKSTSERLAEVGTKFDSAGKKLQSAGRSMTVGLTVPIVGAATASVKAATNIDTALTGVRKTVGGTEEQYRALKDAAIEFSKTSSVTAAQLLDIQALGAQLGFGKDNIEELKEFSEVIAGLDIATNLDAETAATELAQFANIMGMSHDDVSNFASSLIDLGNNMATTEADVMNMAMRIAGAGASMGLTEADVLGLAAALSSVGIEAEAGGTAISTIMSNIDKDVALNSATVEKWGALVGETAESFRDSWDADALGTFQRVLAGMSASDENLSVLLDDLGISSIRQTDVMKRLVNASEMLPDALEIANKAYQDNTALANEVANFNDSLAVKFEMVRNRVTAVAEEIGAPLADAMLEAVDAAEPLFEAIESGARAFADMSDDEQTAVIQTVAVIAALGPALTLFGKVAQNAKVLGGAMSTLANVFARLDVATGPLGKGFEKVGDAADDTAKKATASSVAFGALKGAAIGLAIAGIAVLVKALADYVEKQKTFSKATSGMKAAVDSLATPAQVAASGVVSLGSAAENTTGSIRNWTKAAEDAAQKGAALSQSMQETFDSVQTDSALADRYAQTIADLAGNVDGSATKLQELKIAVEKYNELTGAGITVTDEFSGRVNAQTGELLANTEAYKQNAYAKAAADMSAEAMKREIELEMQLIDVQHDRADAASRLDEINGRIASGDFKSTAELGRLTEEADALAKSIDELNDSEASLTKQRDAAAEQADALTKKSAEYAAASEDAKKRAEELAASTETYSNALKSAGEEQDAFNSLAETLGTDAEDLAKALGDAGVQADEFAALGSTGFKELYDNANQDIGGVIQIIDAANALNIDPKTLTINEDGSIETVEGHIIDLEESTIDGKHFEVTDDGSIQIVTDDIEWLDGLTIGGKTFSVDAVGDAEDTLARIQNRLNSLDGATITVTVTGANAAGGISLTPIRTLSRHADGGIVTSARLTNVGLVGEAGAEAIVPLTNRRYVRPFAKAVADAMGNAGNRTTYVNVELDYSAGEDAITLANDLARALENAWSMEG